MFYISKTKSDIGQNRAGGGAGEAYSAPHPKKNSSAVKFASQGDDHMRTDTQIPVLFPVKDISKTNNQKLLSWWCKFKFFRLYNHVQNFVSLAFENCVFPMIHPLTRITKTAIEHILTNTILDF